MKPDTALSQSQIRKKILRFLDRTAATPDTQPGPYRCGMHHRNALVLATASDNQPRATALEFFHEGLSLYILGVPGGKIGNIRRNPSVSAFIYDQPMDHRVLQQSLQLFGTAELITWRDNRRQFQTRMRRYNMRAVMTRLLEPEARSRNLTGSDAQAFIENFIRACSFIRITPTRIILKEYPPDFTIRRYEWSTGGSKNRS